MVRESVFEDCLLLLSSEHDISLVTFIFCTMLVLGIVKITQGIPDSACEKIKSRACSSQIILRE